MFCNWRVVGAALVGEIEGSGAGEPRDIDTTYPSINQRLVCSALIRSNLTMSSHTAIISSTLNTTNAVRCWASIVSSTPSNEATHSQRPPKQHSSSQRQRHPPQNNSHSSSRGRSLHIHRPILHLTRGRIRQEHPSNIELGWVIRRSKEYGFGFTATRGDAGVGAG